MQRVWAIVEIAQLRSSDVPLFPDEQPAESGGTQVAKFTIRDNLRHRRDIERAYLAGVRTARREILIATAYFFPGVRFRRALISAAARGVKVTLLLQARVEYRLLHYASRALYGQLLTAGVAIQEYHRSFLHAKVAVVDSRWATVGSSNIDPYSFLMSREANVFVRDAAFAGELRVELLQMIESGSRAGPAAGLGESFATGEGGHVDRVRRRARRDGHAALWRRRVVALRLAPPLTAGLEAYCAQSSCTLSTCRLQRLASPDTDMRHAQSMPLPAEAHVPRTQRGDWQTIRTLLPYLWGYRGRIAAALACLVLAKLANVGVPVLMKEIVDSLDPRIAVLTVPLALLVAYGLLRLSTTVFTELREFLFAKVTQRAVRRIGLTVFRHLHALSLRFHLARQTGGLTRDVERGQRGISTLISFALFSILPTLVEISLVSAVLIARYDWTFMAITAVALALYILFTIMITEWRTHFRRQMNELDSKANTRAIDSLLNYETVKYFGNEEWEAQRYDESLQRWERAAVKSQTSLSAPQHRAERDHRHRGVAHHVARDRRRGRTAR